MRQNRRFPGGAQENEAEHVPCCCETGEEALNLYVDGELPVEEQPELFAHLTTCTHCRMLLESVLQFRRMSRLERVAVPPAADEAFLKNLAHHKARRAPAVRHTATLRSGRTFQHSAVAALCVVLLFLAGLWTAGGEPPSPPPTTDHEAERVEPEKDVPATERKALYVFYPGLTVQAQRVKEPTPSGAL